MTLSVEVDEVEVSKKDLLIVYELLAKNPHLRRLAETIAVQASRYAEHFGLRGDLARRLNTKLRAETGESLTPKEMAWANSFCQDVPDLKDLASERLCVLLAEDYNTDSTRQRKRSLLKRKTRKLRQPELKLRKKLR